jgi:hypothetical protein
MKNIHILPTDKPSRVLKTAFGLELLPTASNGWRKPNQNIYIIDDSEIKDVRPHKGKWQLEGGLILNKLPDYLTDLSECKLIIMTTDPELIADGVQAIDDEFLEWFVKNPSCESVKIESLNIGNSKVGYVICKPQEEPKQETIEQSERRYSEEDMFEFSQWISHEDWVYLPSKGYWVNEEQEELEQKLSSKEILNLWFEQFKKK